jgi:CubicO group peptidase (beta-lactamase class C family)
MSEPGMRYIRLSFQKLKLAIHRLFGVIGVLGLLAAVVGGPRVVWAGPEQVGAFEWRKANPESEGMDGAKLETMRAALAERHTKALLVVRNDRVVCEWYQEGHGPDKQHYTASLAKAVVGGMSLAVALSDGCLALDDPAARFVPQWQGDARKARITLRHLGSHTSGLADAEADNLPHDKLTGWKGDFWKQLAPPSDPFTLAREAAPVLFEPGAKLQYSNPGLAMLSYCVTASLRDGPYRDIRTLLRERVMRPIGVPDEKWSVGYGKTYTVEGLPLVGSWGGGGYTARALARVGRLMLREGDWQGTQLLRPEAVRLVTRDADTPGNCGIGWWSNNDGTCSELPRDAFWGSGAGHQVLLIVPSLNLIAVRNGDTLAATAGEPNEYHQPLRRYLFGPLVAAVTDRHGERAIEHPIGAAKNPVVPRTRVSIREGRWFLDDAATYPGAKAEGLLMNVRMVNAVFEDRRRPEFDPNANTGEFLARIPDYVAHGVRAFTVCLQGGMPGYEGAVNSAFNPDGSLRSGYLQRVRRVIETCDHYGAAVILGCYYQRQDQVLQDEAAVRAGVVNVATWVQESGFTNVMLEIANEFGHGGFEHRLLKTADGIAELIGLAKQTAPTLLVSASDLGDGRLPDSVARASDFLLIHFNGTRIEDIPARIAALRRFDKPIVCNEDEKIDAEGAKAAETCVANGASWGFMHVEVNQHFPFTFQGAADDPQVYSALRKMTLPESRPRLIIETDAGGDPDDEQSLVRFLLYANEWDVEGIIANRPVTRRPENKNPENTGLDVVRRLLDAYGECRPNLMQHDARYPTKEFLWQRTVAGYNDTNDAVELILAAVDKDDPRPVWYSDWGTDNGAATNNLQRALDLVLRQRGPERYARFKSKLRLASYDKFGAHTTTIAPPFTIWVNTFQPPVEGKRWYHRFSALTAQAGGFDLVRDVLTDHGPLGALYPTNTTHWGKEGDTMTFLYLVPTGLSEPNQPSWGGWAGRYGPNENFPGKPYYWANRTDTWNGTTSRDNTLARWAADLQNDFRARLDWCVKPPEQANHAPHIIVNGVGGREILHLTAGCGQAVSLDAGLSCDPDGDKLAYEWFVYPEAGTYTGEAALTNPSSPVALLHIPSDAAGKTLHVVLAVHDSGTPPLAAYRRVIVQVSGQSVSTAASDDGGGTAYFPPPESQGGWRKLDTAEEIRKVGGMDPAKLDDLKQWLLASDDRDFAAVVIRRGYLVLELERGNSAKTDARRVASVSKAVCATVLAIASEQSQRGATPRKMSFDDPAFDFIPWAQPLSDPRKAKITVKQLLNHTSGLCPEATGAPNDGTWEYILGHTGDPRTAQLAFDPGTGCGYSTHALHHAALVCETVTGKPYDQFAIEVLFKPLGIEHWWFQYFDDAKIGRHPTHGLGMPARDLARIAYCMLRGGRWGDRQVIPSWFVEETAAPTHNVRSPEMRWQLNPQIFSHGWELPARLTGEDGRSGQGIPADARDKPGSGGQLIAFVPSLDLVVTRQTGSSGGWAYEEYLRRACAAVLREPEGNDK